jgi:putative nucleotidyltransferase with HDIG domain
VRWVAYEGPVTYVVPSPLVTEASSLTRFLLRDQPRRLAHSEEAGRRAMAVAARIPGRIDGELVVAAALLHDVGYSPDVKRTGFHPLDGALFLARTDWPDALVRLVAHHSHATLIAPYHGAGAHLAVIPPLHGLETDVVTYADVTAGRRGTGSTVQDRIAEMRSRQERSKVPAEVREARYALLADTVRRVEAVLAGEVADMRRRRPRLFPTPAPPADRPHRPGAT